MTFKKLLAITILFTGTSYGQGLTARQIKAATIKNGSATLTLPTTTDTMVGRATTDTLSTKTLVLPSTDIVTWDDQASTPSNPASGFYKTYVKTDGKAYILNPSGTESKMGSGGGVFEAPQNLILNNSFESDTSGWTASGGTFVRVTAAGNIIPPGIGSASWDPSATSQTLSYTATTVTSNDGLSGRNGVISCSIKTAATDLKMQAYDGSNVITPNSATDLVPSSSTGFRRYSLNFIIPASGTIQARFLSASDSAIAYIDDCYFGLAEGFNISSVSQAQFMGTLTYAPAASCSWSVTATSFTSYSADTDCSAATVTGLVSAPGTKIPGAVISNAPPGEYVVYTEFTGNPGGNKCFYRVSDGTNASGELYLGAAGGGRTLVSRFSETLSTSTLTFQIQGANNTGATACDVDNNTTTPATSESFSMKIYRFPLSSDVVYKPDSSAQSWSGYHDNTCSWGRTNAAFGDPTADASCALTQRTSTNITFAAAGSVLPQITGTMDVADYLVCATASVFQGTASASGALQLIDGSSVVIAQQGFDADTTADETKAHTLCGLYRPTSAGSKTIGFQSRASSGSITISGNPVGIEWLVVKTSQSLPSPLLVGSINSNSTGVERIERAYFTNTGSCATSYQSGTWISSVADPGVGQCTINFTAGMFSFKPTCFVNSETISASCTTQGEASTSSVLARCRSTVAGTDVDVAFSLMCMGPR